MDEALRENKGHPPPTPVLYIISIPRLNRSRCSPVCHKSKAGWLDTLTREIRDAFFQRTTPESLRSLLNTCIPTTENLKNIKFTAPCLEFNKLHYCGIG